MATVIEREEIKKHEELLVLKSHLLANHVIPKHTEKMLEANKDVENFCEESRHFAITGPLHLFYDVSTWIGKKAYLIKIERIGIYDDFMEYNIDRLKSIHSTPHSSGGDLN